MTQKTDTVKSLLDEIILGIENVKGEEILILDLRLGSFFKYCFAPAKEVSYIIGLHSTDQSSQPDEFQKMKYLKCILN